MGRVQSLAQLSPSLFNNITQKVWTSHHIATWQQHLPTQDGGGDHLLPGLHPHPHAPLQLCYQYPARSSKVPPANIQVLGGVLWSWHSLDIVQSSSWVFHYWVLFSRCCLLSPRSPTWQTMHFDQDFPFLYRQRGWIRLNRNFCPLEVFAAGQDLKYFLLK